MEYVKSSFGWDGYYGKYAGRKPKEVIANKKGNSAEINLLLTNLLQQAGVDAQPVLISTRSHGKIKEDYPFVEFFNYVIVLINDGTSTYLADGTDRFLAYNRIPPRAINDGGLVMSTEEVRWVDLYSQISATDTYNIEFTLDPEEGTSDVKITNITTEFESYKDKRTYNNDQEKIKNEFIEGLHEVSRIKTVNYDKADRPYIVSLEGTQPIEFVGDNILIYPFLGIPISENPFTQETRNYPIDFVYKRNLSYKSIINIPDGYEVTEISAPYVMTNNVMDVNYEVTANENQVSVTGEVKLKRAVYPPGEYSRIKRYFGSFITRFNQIIVLEKKEDAEITDGQ